MKPNIGTKDKIIRLLLTLAILGVGAYFRSTWGVLAILPLFTAAASYCPLYAILGINTTEKARSDKH